MVDGLRSVGYSQSHGNLVDWLCEHARIRKVEVFEPFRAALEALLTRGEGWESGPRALDCLDECFMALGGERSDSYLFTLAEHTSEAAKLNLEKENASFLLQDHSAALVSILGRGARLSPDLVARVQERVVALRKNELASKDDESSLGSSYTAESQKKEFHLEGLFSTLLER